MIRVVDEQTVCSIELLDQDNAHERMRQGQRRQRPAQICALLDRGGETVWSAYQKGQIASRMATSIEPF